MQTNAILSAPLIDLIFDGRNKAYGAYELRKTYSSRMTKALVITFLLTMLLVSLSFFSNGNRDNRQQVRIVPGVELSDLPDVKEPVPEPETQPQPEQTPVRTEPLTDINIVPDDEQDNPPATIDDLLNAQVGTDRRDGSDFDGTVQSQTPVVAGSGGIIDQPVSPETDE
ncbi:MAG TPA: hypothetical protein VFV31_02735, partial [Chitinophagaceae bacterium]|nr:hypothetical protein [Chitinophagaceae bacterium]